MIKLLALVVVTLTSTSAALASASPDTRDGGPRVRLTDARLSQLLQNGMMRSPTFKAMVDRIEAGNVIVYMSLAPTLRSYLAGRLTWMSRAGGYRYLRAQISTDLNPDSMIATMAHELQHALEVSQDPNVTDQRTLTELYKRIGRETRTSVTSEWETAAAQEVGWQVRKELVALPTVLARANPSDRL